METGRKSVGKIIKKIKTQTTDNKHSSIASFSVENRQKILAQNEDNAIKIRPKSSVLHQKSSSNLKGARLSI